MFFLLGSDRIKEPEILYEKDMVITTYHIVAQEAREAERDNGIHAVKWLRVVLDEAHIIRSRKTKIWRACKSRFFFFVLFPVQIQNNSRNNFK